MEELKLVRGEYQDTRCWALEYDGEVTYVGIQQTQAWIVKVSQAHYIVNRDKACISSKLADLIYNKVEKNQVLRIENKQQGLNTTEVKGRIVLDDKQEMNPCEALLIQDVEVEDKT